MRLVDCVLTSVTQFVLDTTAMSYDGLARAHLRAIDVIRDPQTGIHGHFPLVIDAILSRGLGRRQESESLRVQAAADGTAAIEDVIVL
jgi:hypothetical protein